MRSFLSQAGLLAGCLLAQALFGGVAEAVPPLPDFVIESLAVGPETIVQGRPLAVTAVVKNQGSAAGDARHLDVWYHWTNDVAPAFGDVGDSWALVGRLAAGESRSVVLPPQILDHAGTNHLCARIEFENLVSESINTNNHLCVAYVAESISFLRRPVHRFWSPVFAAHFFTINETEKKNVIRDLSASWTYEGVAYYAYPVQVPETVPLHRFWSPVFAGHFFTISETEKNNVIRDLSAYWTYEGVAYYVHPSQAADTLPVYRFWSPVFAHHFYTINETEKNNVIRDLSAYWTYEGVAYYAIPSAARAFSPSGSRELAQASAMGEEGSLVAGASTFEPQPLNGEDEVPDALDVDSAAASIAPGG